jgi:hypothetical protein
MIDEVPVREMVLRPENLQYRFAIALNRFTSLGAFGLTGRTEFQGVPPFALNYLRDSRPRAGRNPSVGIVGEIVCEVSP